jgi:Kelch motif protein/galactose oxidase-like protein
MTTQRELDRILDGFLADGTNELADRVIQAALTDIDHTPQRRHLRAPRRFPSITQMQTRLAVAAVIGVLAVGGALYLTRPSQNGVGTSSPSPQASGASNESLPASVAPAGMAQARQLHTATTLADGRVLIVGGYGFGGAVAISLAELYDPATSSFRSTGELTPARGMNTATRLSDGRVLIAGGGPASWVTGVGPFLDVAALYDPGTGAFSPTGSMATAREGHTATLLANGRVLIAGGADRVDHAVASAELYDPTTGTFSPTGSMTTARAFQTATRLSDGRVLMTGGDPSPWLAPGPYIASAEIYDPATGTFSPTGPMAEGREWHVATLLSDGRVLITGGVTNASPAPSLASAEIYDPTSGTFSPTGSMTTPRAYQTSTLLDDGRVLIVGGLANGRAYGDNPTFLASAEIYDPTTGTFTATGALATMRAAHTASLLPDGRVLIAAGAFDAAVTTLASAEIYDPTTGTFSPAG